MFCRLATSSIALAALAAPALSEITPAELWDQMVAESASVGVTLTEGGREEAGDTLTITDIVMTSGSETAPATFNVPKIVMNQTGDGNVRWSVEGDITGEMTTVPPEGEPITAPITMSLGENETTSSGSVDDLTHDYRLDKLTVTAEVPTTDGSGDSFTVGATMEQVTGTQRSIASGSAGGREVSYDAEAAKVTGTVDSKADKADGEGPDMVSGQYAMDAVKLSGQMAMPTESFDLESQMEEAIVAGLNIGLNVGYDSATGGFAFSGKDETGKDVSGEGKMSAGPGELAVAISDQGLAYSASIQTSENSMSSSAMPFPVVYSVDSGKVEVQIPAVSSDEPAPFHLISALSGLKINDELWAIFDPSAKLPRDPADVTIDVSGEIVMPQSIFHMPKDEAEMAMSVPPKPVSLSINDVTVKAVGAEAHVTGQLDAAEGASLADQPVGKISGEFTGINPLLDTLAGMGLLPQEQLMAARMMLTMFARPAEGNPDMLTTELDFREDGSIFANGQQVK